MAILLSLGKTFPLETLIVGRPGCASGAGSSLYVGELMVIGWIVDLPEWLATRALPPAHVPLTVEHVGPIAVVTLSDNIASERECRSVAQQLDRLIADHCCDFVFDFSRIKKLSSGFRDVLLHATQAARAEAERQGKPYRNLELPSGATFRIYDDRERAVEKMARHAGHGWVVLCAVPVGIRAVSDAE